MAVLEALAAASDHLSADDVWFALRTRGASVSRATVYRTLAHLSAAGLVREVPLGAGHAHFELAREGDHHEHLICDRCGAVVEVHEPRVEDSLLRVCTAQGFVPSTHTVEVRGLCARCASRAGSRRGKRSP
jgi:Fur family ferric uptake transcriptional regulator